MKRNEMKNQNHNWNGTEIKRKNSLFFCEKENKLGFGLNVLAIPRLRVSVLLLFAPEGAREDGSSGRDHERIYLSRRPCTPWLNRLHVLKRSPVDEQNGIRTQLACRHRA